MAFFYRVFTTVEKNIWAKEIEAFLNENDLGVDMVGVVEEEEQDNLDATPVCLIFIDGQDRELAALVYDKRGESEILEDELDEFHSLVDEMAPEVNRAWVHEQLDKTVGCFAFEIKEAGLEEAAWNAIATIAEWLRNETNGFEQSDGGQITNENGAVVLTTPDDFDDDEFEEFDEDDEEEFEDDEEEEDSDEGEEESEDEEEFDDSNYEEEYEYGEDEEEFYDDEEDDSEDEDSEEEDGESDDEDEDEDEDDEWENFVAAIRVGDSWVEKTIESEEDLDNFLAGNA